MSRLVRKPDVKDIGERSLHISIWNLPRFWKLYKKKDVSSIAYWLAPRRNTAWISLTHVHMISHSQIKLSHSEVPLKVESHENDSTFYYRNMTDPLQEIIKFFEHRNREANIQRIIILLDTEI